MTAHSLALAAALLWGPAFAESPAPLPPAAAGLGLEAEGDAWVYRRRHPSEDRVVRRVLTAGERETVAKFLKILPPDPEGLLAAVARRALEKGGLKPEDTVWFEKGAGPPKLTALGKGAVIGIVLGDPWGDKSADSVEAVEAPTAAPAPPKPKIDASKVASALPGAAPVSFDGAKPAPPAPSLEDGRPAVYLGWSTFPTAEMRGKTIAGAYQLYGWSSDRALDAAFGPGAGGGGKTAARWAKGLALDIPIGLFGSFWQHELGHFDSGWAAGLVPGWEKTENFLGATLVDKSKMSPRESMDYSGAGIFSTQAGASRYRLEMLAGDSIPWSALPMWSFWKADASVYNFITPPPGKVGGTTGGWDPVDWREEYAARSGRSEKALYAQMLGGAAWNALDPMSVWAAYQYFYGYLTKGRESAPNPMPRIGPIQVWAGTGFWLSEIGPQYRLGLQGREPKSKVIGEVAVTAGDDSQGTVEVSVGGVPVGPWTRVRAKAAGWLQRAGAEPGAKAPGGALGVGLDQHAGGPFSVSAEGGYKSPGALLGRGFGAGPYLEFGVKGNLP